MSPSAAAMAATDAGCPKHHVETRHNGGEKWLGHLEATPVAPRRVLGGTSSPRGSMRFEQNMGRQDRLMLSQRMLKLGLGRVLKLRQSERLGPISDRVTGIN